MAIPLHRNGIMGGGEQGEKDIKNKEKSENMKYFHA